MQPLTLIAQEVTRAINLVWGGIEIASRLNYKIMSSAVQYLGHTIELLLLLIAKTTTLILILRDDILLFLSDIGSGCISIIYMVMRLGDGIVNITNAFANSVVTSFIYISMLFNSLYLSIWNGIHLSVDIITTGVQTLFQCLSLLGSSFLFLITFIPTTVYYGLIKMKDLTFSAGTLLCTTAHDFFVDSVMYATYCYSSILKKANNITYESIIGFVILIICICSIKYFWGYIRPYLRGIPDLTSNVLLDLRSCFVTFYILACGSLTSIRMSFWHTIGARQDRQVHRVINDIEPPEEHTGLARRPLTRSRNPLGLPMEIDEEDVRLRRSPRKVLRSRSIDDISAGSSSRETASELRRALASELDQQLCVVCQDRRKCIILLPCKHLCVCFQCKTNLIHREIPCPICRKEIEDSIRVYA